MNFKFSFILFCLVLGTIIGFISFYFNYQRNEIRLSSNRLENYPLINYDQAKDRTDEMLTVKMPVKYLFNNGKYLIFSSRVNPHHGYMEPDETKRVGYFTAKILVEDLARFPVDFQGIIENKTILVSGKITWYQGDPHIEVRDPSQIEIL